MRKVVYGAVAAVALAWAHGAQADHHTAETQRKKAEQAGQPGSQSAGTAAGREMGTGEPDRTSRELRNDARADSNPGNVHGEFDGKKNYDLDGKVRQASAGEITIERKDGLPPATLKVGSGTKIEVDGKRSSASQLQAGQDVKASFNLRGGSPEAVEVKAKKPDEKDRRELGEQQRENRQDRAKEGRPQR